MSGKPPDDTDRAKAGTLPSDPSTDTVKAKPPLRAVGPNERRPPDEPCDLPAERALLGALLWAGQNQPSELRISVVLDLLETGEPFYQRGAGNVYEAAKACHEAKQEHDPVAVHSAMLRAGHRSDLDKLRELVAEASTVSEIQARVYAQSIRDAWARRKVISEARLLIEEARSPKATANELSSKAQAVAAKYAERSASSAATVSAKESSEAFFRDVEEKKNTAIPTGLYGLDEALNGGLRPGEVSVLAARANVGKSCLAAQICENMVTVDPKMGVLYVTLEMAHKMFTARLVAARSGVPLTNLRRMVLNQTQRDAIEKTVKDMATKGLYFADNPSQTLASIWSAAKDRARLLAREGRRLGLVVIDHIGLVKPSAELLKKATREQQVAETSRGQRMIASDVGCHVLSVCQIHRDAERQPTQSMPKLHHLRESGAIEQDADLVFILHRERLPKSGMFNNDKPPAFAIAKGRMDETAIMLLGYDPPHARFYDWPGGPGREFGDFYEF